MELSRERRLLLACARVHLSAQDCQRILDLADKRLDWDQIALVSNCQGIAPLTYHSLSKSGAIRVLPSGTAQSLRAAYYANAARNSQLYHELRTVLDVFSRHGINTIVLKGAALAQSVYQNPALRPMCDIDLLVRRDNLAGAEAELLKMGYMLELPEKSYLQNHHYHFAFEKFRSITVELHWHLKRPTDAFMIDLEGLWERSQKVKISGVETFTLSPQDTVLYLCQHFWKHKLIGGIRPLCDIAETTRFFNTEINWPGLVNTSSDWRMNSCSYLALWLARELLHAPVPADALSELRPPRFDTNVIGWARETLLGYGECAAVFPDFFALFWKGGSPKERWNVLQKTLSRGYDDSNLRAGHTSACNHYSGRIKHLLTQYGPTVARLWSGDRKIRAAAETEVKKQQLTKWLASEHS